MKIFTFILLFISLTTLQKEPTKIKLEGKYKMEFESDFVAQNCLVKIKGNKYVKTFDNGVNKNGTINILKLKFSQLLILKEKNSDIEVHVPDETFHPSDTIFFRTKKVDEKDAGDALTIYSGKLIKLR